MIVDTSMPIERRAVIVERVKEAIAMRPAGLILDASSIFPFDDLLEDFRGQHNLCTVFRHETNLDFACDQVLSDDAQGGRLAADHLLGLGHEDILFVCPEPKTLTSDSTARRLLEGCKQAFSAKGLRWDGNRIYCSQQSPGLGSGKRRTTTAGQRSSDSGFRDE